MLQVRQNDLMTGNTKSCGCLHEEAMREQTGPRTHGLTRHYMYRTWANMLRRCENPQDHFYYRYGGRGITVCERWHDVKLFIADIESLLGFRPPGMTLDRKDNDGNYEPGNVRWATAAEQVANRG